MSSSDAPVDLWVTQSSWCDDARSIRHFESLCDTEELARLARYRHKGARLHALIARALCRTVLSRYEALAPEAWRFTQNEYGRPRLIEAQNPRDLRFNLSHTFGCIVMAVSRGREVGIDVEDAQRKSRTTAIAHRFFAPVEVEALKRLPIERQRQRFFTYWTLKEAYIKARGLGLAIPLAKFSFDVDTPGAIMLHTDSSLHDAPGRWRFAHAQLTERYPLSLALEVDPGSTMQMSLHQGIPGGEWRSETVALTATSGAVRWGDNLGVSAHTELTR